MITEVSPTPSKCNTSYGNWFVPYTLIEGKWAMRMTKFFFRKRDALAWIQNPTLD